MAGQATICVWHDLTLYRGSTPAAAVHAHYPIAVVVPVSGRAVLHAEVEGLRLSTAAGWVVGSGARHCFAPGIPVVMLLVGACTSLGLSLRGFLAGRPAVPVPHLAAEPLRDLIADRREENWEAVSAACAGFSGLCAQGSRPVVVAPRLIRALHEVERRAAWETLTLDELAASVAVSPSRLRALFHGQAELSFRQYRRWIRLWLGILAAFDGARLRDAAHEVGFADQAHFSRTCRLSFGLSPVDIVRLGPAHLSSPGALATASGHAAAVGASPAAPELIRSSWLANRNKGFHPER